MSLFPETHTCTNLYRPSRSTSAFDVAGWTSTAQRKCSYSRHFHRSTIPLTLSSSRRTTRIDIARYVLSKNNSRDVMIVDPLVFNWSTYDCALPCFKHLLTTGTNMETVLKLFSEWSSYYVTTSGEVADLIENASHGLVFINMGN